MSGTDIGGFEPKTDENWCPSPELFIRWIQAGCLLPWFRNHYKGIAKGGKEWQEPFNFERRIAEVAEDDKWIFRAVLPITRHYVELRYRLMQLLYDGLFYNTLTGMPITRALFVNFPKDKSLYGPNQAFLDNEFFVGDDLLVAPVLESDSINGGSRDVYLQAGSA
jgi:alpha-glucosidase